ncbi:hypothetical protein E2C01_040280 [Portunus trituberculatus]|uniref:Uncharacterized protein n=1 Tax=Portunus trituberculatus TaxID=210409 RepID=A0A5B7FG30_PORTR|nr:hypothetical protein [Portunus trituberculatus]
MDLGHTSGTCSGYVFRCYVTTKTTIIFIIIIIIIIFIIIINSETVLMFALLSLFFAWEVL